MCLLYGSLQASESLLRRARFIYGPIKGITPHTDLFSHEVATGGTREAKQPFLRRGVGTAHRLLERLEFVYFNSWNRCTLII